MNNKLTKMTEGILIPGKYNKKCLCSSELECVETKAQQKCILVFGINPSGGENDARAEKNALYLYYLPDCSIKDRTYSRFYKPIFETVSSATKNNSKWGWCNYSLKELQVRINNDVILHNYSDMIQAHYSEYKDKEYSVYIGEFFYYHMKDQNEFLKLVDDSRQDEYIEKMLKMHIDEIENSNNTISCILINNATASKMVLKALHINDFPTSYDYYYKNKRYRMFFSAMLSGPAADVFSKQRLVNEMNRFLV